MAKNMSSDEDKSAGGGVSVGKGAGGGVSAGKGAGERRVSGVFWLTRTAILIALLIIIQAATAPLGNTLVTGSIVNMVLIVAVMTSGFLTGLSVAAVSPVMAKLFNIGPLWGIIPFIAAGNIALIALWHIVANRQFAKQPAPRVAALAAAAVAKFAVLYVGIVKIAVPLFLRMPEPQATIISNMFSLPQLFTASVGGVLAMAVYPSLRKAIGSKFYL